MKRSLNFTNSAETEFAPPSKRALRTINSQMVAQYGARQPHPRDALDGLILIILSQATNDINCDRAFTSLKNRFPTWPQVLAATDEDVADSIRSGGLANQKAKRIRQLLSDIQTQCGSLDLSWMHDATAAQCEKFLAQFHGVGPKTIACVLVFFLNKPAFPVDTHVLRVCKRLGWLRPNASADEAHKVLGIAVPDECKLDLHVNLISHGRAICCATGNGGPKCGNCILRPKCRTGKALKLPRDEIASNVTASKIGHGGDFFVTVG